MLKFTDLFFALKGDRCDGHDFIGQAVARGAIGVVVSRDISVEKAVVFRVNDTLGALGDLAQFYRKRFDIKCVAVTGSNGKTTTKEMLSTCLETRYRTLKTKGNFNNLIGLPLSLLDLDDGHQVGLFELGMSVPGEITRLARICRPQVGVFTNIAPVHLETMGSVEAVAKAKYELVESLPRNGAVILNADDKYLSEWRDRIDQDVITFGLINDADFKVDEYRFSGDGLSSFFIRGVEFEINLPGICNIYNAVCAAAAAFYLGCNLESLVEPLRKMKPYHLRSEIFESDGVIFIDDCYNANPVSMKSAIDVLAEYPSKGRKIAVLGDMLELGDNQDDFHVEIGRYLNLKNIDAVFAIGKLARLYLNEPGTGENEHFNRKDKLALRLREYLQPGDVVLVKGSRAIALEEISKMFRGNR